MKFSGLMCLSMKNICEKFCCKQTSTWKIIVLAFIYVNLHPAYSIKWCIYASISTEDVNQKYGLWAI